MTGVSIADRAPWLSEPGLQALLACLSHDGELARIAGGAVRNTLLGEAVADIDLATTTLPDETIRRAEGAGFRAVKTGYEHGTITVIAGGIPHEVTTLRADVETDGRRAKVVYGRDWKADAERRDFTINALYADADGTVVDFVGGLDDVASRSLRFIGDAEMRIREDYLRILRFFRFFAWYGDGRPDAEGLKACARLKDGMARLSAERVWHELRRLLQAPDPSRALLWMRQTSVLAQVLPESEKWGIDAIRPLVATEAAMQWEPDALLRLEAIVPPDAPRLAEMARRLRLSNAEAERMQDWALAEKPAAELTESQLARLLYRERPDGIVDGMKLALSSARERAASEDKALVEAGGYARLLKFADQWKKPVFPLKGADLLAAGHKPGPKMGETLAALEAKWIESGFALTRASLLALLNKQ
ncbi:MAG: CCA tRNA nucleotidyltransferase [Notoacmeibacter sp.]|nr:CCA tRNA nucleotidyltransferase [Notoacmeibacter sp.]